MSGDRDPVQTEYAGLFGEGPKTADQRTMEERSQAFGGDTGEVEGYEPVEVDLSQPVPEKPKPGEQPRAAPPQPPANSGIEELQRQLRATSERTAQLERAAEQFAQRALNAEQRANVSTMGMIDAAISESQQASAIATARLEAALNAGNYQAAAAVQAEISSAQHNLLRLQEQKAMVEAEARQPPQQQFQQRAAPPQQPDPGAIFQDLTNNGFPRSAQWLRNHPELMNPAQLKRVSLAHNSLVDLHGFVPETDAYFAAMEREIYGERRPAGAPTNGAGRRPAAAPVSNTAPSLRTGEVKRNYVPLSREQRHAAAEMHGMSDREFAEAYEDARTAGQLMLGRTS